MTHSTGLEELHPTLMHHIVNQLGWSSLREVQRLSVAPIKRGNNVVILAPTAGGKTEAAFFPILSRLLEDNWSGLSVIYLSPIRALLNNQATRLERLFGMVGHTAQVWHGDVSSHIKEKIRRDPPSVLLTTPESIESMLISVKTPAVKMFSQLQVVVIDEVHAFAGDDRGWHLLGVLQRLQAYANRDIQRIGLSATVGNREEIVSWLSAGSSRSQATIDPPKPRISQPEVTLDWVATLENAAQVIEKIHVGQRRLVFCDSRIQAEKLTRLLRARDVSTHIIHGSLSSSERADTERSFIQGGEGVIVATSALELGIDIGDLDRVINIDAPMTVASFLQRMGRTGRRPGKTSNMLFLCVSEPGIVRAAALLELWASGYVEPVNAPSQPLHILAQQIMALVIEQPGVAINDLKDAVRPFIQAAALELKDAQVLLQHLFQAQYLFADGASIGIGLQGEKELSGKNYLELVSVFTTPPIFRVIQGRRELGSVHQSTFMSNSSEEGKLRPIVILLAGRTWRVVTINWPKRVAYVEPFDVAGTSRWLGSAPPMTSALAQAHQKVLTGQACTRHMWSKRACHEFDALLDGYVWLSEKGASLIEGDGQVEYWNFAGTKANALLAARLKLVGLDEPSSDGLSLSFSKTMVVDKVRRSLGEARLLEEIPKVSSKHPALEQLKFHQLLPESLLIKALASRLYGI